MTLPRGTNYTYLIGWSKFNFWYYGSRVANKSQPEDDLWKKYFTSSKYVKEKRKSYGEPDVIQIRKTFDDPIKAKEWETKVIRRMRMAKLGKPSWNKGLSKGASL